MKSFGMKNMHIRRRFLPDAGSHSSPKSQGYPDECRKSALTSKIAVVNGKPQLYGRAVESVQNHRRTALLVTTRDRASGEPRKSSTSTKTE